MKKNVVIELNQVSKRYTLHHEKPTVIENLLFSKKKDQFTALKDVNLKIYQGEKVGIIGPNGSGKTTLLKLITSISAPTTGRVFMQGKAISLLDLEAGFHPDLTGEENIFLNGLIIGLSRSEIKKKYHQIIKFAGLEKFITAPLYTYSQGMKLRLGFSIAVSANPDILILDEGFMAGDIDFREKMEKKIREFFKQRKTVLIVTHWTDYLKKHCQRIIWIEKGKIKKDGGTEIIDLYEKLGVK